jgi:nucleotide-binding universal stress UspA family protein
MNRTAPAPIVVGVDGSTSSAHAVTMGAQEAAQQHRPLCLMHAFNWIPDGPAGRGGRSRQEVEQLLDAAAHDAKLAAPGVEPIVRIVEGHPVTALLRACTHAAMLVIGEGNLSSYVCVPVDCTAVQIVARADCCVTVAREADPPPGPVLVGVDGTAAGDQALGFAFDTAAQRDAELLVVSVIDQEAESAEPAPAMPADGVAQWRRKYPGVVVHQHELRGDPPRVLVEESQRAALVVVGARGEHPSRSLLGPVSLAVLHHAPCPVVVVRGSPELTGA